MRALLSTYANFIKKANEDAQDRTFGLDIVWELGNFYSFYVDLVATPTPTTGKTTPMRRAGTIIRSPLEGRNKDKEKGPDGDMRASEVIFFLSNQSIFS